MVLSCCRPPLSQECLCCPFQHLKESWGASQSQSAWTPAASHYWMRAHSHSKNGWTTWDTSTTHSHPLKGNLASYLHVMYNTSDLFSKYLHALYKVIHYSQLGPVDDCLTLLAGPETARRIRVLLDRFWCILDTVASLVRSDEVAILGLRRECQDLLERVDVLQETLLAGNTQIVDQGEMLSVLIQTDAAAVRDNRDVESMGYVRDGPKKWEYTQL